MVSVIPITNDVVNFDYGNVTSIFDFYQISLKENLTGSFYTEEINMTFPKEL